MLADAFEEDVDNQGDFISQTILQCVKALPTKTPIYATLVGLVNLAKPSFGSSFVAQTAVDLSNSLLNKNHDEIRPLVRWLGALCVVGVVDVRPYVDLLQDLVGVVQEEKCDCLSADALIFAVISALPWVGANFSSDLSAILDTIETYMTNRASDSSHRCNSAMYRLQELDHDVVARSEDLLSNWWQAIKLMQDDEWKTDAIVSPYASFEEELKEGTAHKFSISRIPSQDGETTYVLRPDLRLYNPDLNLDKDLRPIDRLILSNYINDTVTNFERLPKEGIKKLVLLPLGVDKYLHLVVETLLSNMLAVPKPRLHPICYQSLFVNLFKALPKKMPPLVGRAINNLFLAVHTFDVDVRDTLAQWFSYHLSNFGYKWPWANWEHVLGASELTPQKVFVKAALLLCVRLSFRDRIKDTLPSNFHNLLPDEPKAIFKYSKEALEEADEERREELSALVELADLLLDKLRSKKVPSEETEEFLKENLDTPQKRLSLLFPTLLYAGSKTFSHLQSVITRYAPVVENLKFEGSQRRLLVDVLETWRKSPKHVMVVVDRLVSLRVVSPAAVLDWVLANQTSYSESWVWQLLFGCVSDTLAKMNATLSDLKEQQKGFAAMNEDAKVQKTRRASDILCAQKKDMFLMICNRLKDALSYAEEQQELLLNLVEARFKQFIRMFHKDIANYMEDVAAVFEGGGAAESAWNTYSSGLIARNAT